MKVVLFEKVEGQPETATEVKSLEELWAAMQDLQDEGVSRAWVGFEVQDSPCSTRYMSLTVDG